MPSPFFILARTFIDAFTRTADKVDVPAQNVEFTIVDKEGKAVSIAEVAKRLGTTGKPDETAGNFSIRLPNAENLGPLTGAIARGFAAAFASVSVILSAGPIMAELPFIRPLRKAFSPVQLAAAEYILAARFGVITFAEASDKAQELGLSIVDFNTLVKVTEAIPGPQDVITFAVREVYNPAQRAALDLDAEFGEFIVQARPDLKAIGMSDETIGKFWAAHWVLPSITQGFNMLHRGVVNQGELNALLKAKDIAPVWRKRISEIAFALLTRVDIRRMHKLDILDRAGVKAAYVQLGYNEENAENLTEFTERLNSDPESGQETISDREATKQRDLTRSDILRGFREGLLSRTQSTDALEGLGFTTLESDFMLLRAEFDEAVSEVGRITKELREGFLAGLTDETKIKQVYAEFGLPSVFVEKQLLKFRAEKESRITLPSQSQMLKWFEAKIKTRSQTQTFLEGKGFNQEDVQAFLEDNKPGGKDGKTA